MDQKESLSQEGVAAAQIKAEPGITIKTEPGAARVKEEPSSTSLREDRRMSRLLQEYSRRPFQPPKGRVVRFKALKKLKCLRQGCLFRAARQVCAFIGQICLI